MKALLLTILLLISANAVSFSWVESKLNGTSTIPSTNNEVAASGWDFRSYTYLDTAGRICTVVFTDNKGGAVDCDFPPENFNYQTFINKTKQ